MNRLPNLGKTVLAFRGYNVKNLGRTAELLADERYSPLLREELQNASEHASRLLQRDVCLVDFVERQQEPNLEQYGEAVALVLAVSSAQIRCLKEVHQTSAQDAMLLMGYSLGEIAALVAGGTLTIEAAMTAPLPLANDCVALAKEVKLGVLFNRRSRLDMQLMERSLLETNLDGNGVIGISAVLSPNSVLTMGQGDTLQRFHQRVKAGSEDRIHLKRNPNSWPPMHTPIVWQRNIPSRAAQLMLTMPGGLTAPDPPVLSLVTGDTTYTDLNVRETLCRWTDRRQHLWSAVYELLSRGTETVVHVGPQPNIIPATLKRLSDNVEAQTRGSLGMRTLARLVARPWLQAMLPQSTALLRAPQLGQIVLEDWLLEN